MTVMSLPCQDPDCHDVAGPHDHDINTGAVVIRMSRRVRTPQQAALGLTEMVCADCGQPRGLEHNCQRMFTKDRAGNVAQVSECRFCGMVIGTDPRQRGIHMDLAHSGLADKLRNWKPGHGAPTEARPYCPQCGHLPAQHWPGQGCMVEITSDSGLCICELNETEAARVAEPETEPEIMMPPVPERTPVPDYYAADGGMQPWDVWEAFDLDPWAANAIKYLLRAGKKPGEEKIKDLGKAITYIKEMIRQETINAGTAVRGDGRDGGGAGERPGSGSVAPE
jgi:hypothetical protein